MGMVREICTGILSLVQDFQLKRKQVEVIIEASADICEQLNQYDGVIASKLLVQSYTVTDAASIPNGYLLRKAMPGVTIHLNIGAVTNPDKLIEQFERRVTKVQEKIDKLQTSNHGNSKESDKLQTSNHGNSKEIDTAKRDSFQQELQTIKEYTEVLNKL